jgi:hypothetical protein
MSQRITLKATITLAALIVLPAPSVRAQDNCQSFRAVIPLTFDINAGWTGPVYAVMGSEILIGKWSIDVPPQTSCSTASCQDTVGRSRIDFGGSGLMNPGDTITVELQMATYDLPDGFGTYRAMWKIVGGTGRFAQVSGVGFESGPFVAWMDAKDIPQGKYIGEISAEMCGVRPATNPQSASSAKPLNPAGFPAAFSFDPRRFSLSVRK